MTARTKLTIAMPSELVIALDDVRGDISRSMFLQRAVERYIKTIENLRQKPPVGISSLKRRKR